MRWGYFPNLTLWPLLADFIGQKNCIDPVGDSDKETVADCTDYAG
jgi:hypothetical protein